EPRSAIRATTAGTEVLGSYYKVSELTALLVGRDPDEPSRRVIAPVKQNLCEPGAAVAFSLEPAGKAVRVVWTGETAHTADGLLVQPVRSEERIAQTEAVEFLRAALAGGERPASDVLSSGKPPHSGSRRSPCAAPARRSAFRCG